MNKLSINRSISTFNSFFSHVCYCILNIWTTVTPSGTASYLDCGRSPGPSQWAPWRHPWPDHKPAADHTGPPASPSSPPPAQLTSLRTSGKASAAHHCSAAPGAAPVGQSSPGQNDAVRGLEKLLSNKKCVRTHGLSNYKSEIWRLGEQSNKKTNVHTDLQNENQSKLIPTICSFKRGMFWMWHSPPQWERFPPDDLRSSPSLQPSLAADLSVWQSDSENNSVKHQAFLFLIQTLKPTKKCFFSACSQRFLLTSFNVDRYVSDKQVNVNIWVYCHFLKRNKCTNVNVWMESRVKSWP